MSNGQYPVECTSKYPVWLMDRFEFKSYGHAIEILHDAFMDEWTEILSALENLTITIPELKKGGGNETDIPKKFDEILYPKGWQEIKIKGDLSVKIFPRKGRKGSFGDEPTRTQLIKGWIDGHNIDFVKGKVAFDLEWNSKDQTFDRDLLAMRTYFDCGIIDVGVIVTRSQDLDEVFKSIPDGKDKHGKPQTLMRKYGASTTWMGKLTPRLDSRRNGGCPIMAVGIKNKCVTDWKTGNELA